MIAYFADRRYSILGIASSRGHSGDIKISSDETSSDVETGVRTLTLTLEHTYSDYSDDTYSQMSDMCAVGNYVLVKSELVEDDLVYQIITSEENSYEQTIEVYCEDAGLDLLNEIALKYPELYAEPQKGKHPCAWYVNFFAADSGFEIGTDESDANDTKELTWDSEQTITERILDIAEQWGCYITYSFKIDRLTVTHRYINIRKAEKKDVVKQLRMGHEIKSITIKRSIEHVATALMPLGSKDADNVTVTMSTPSQYKYDDGNYYVDFKLLKSRSALAEWGRYVPKDTTYTTYAQNHVIKTFEYDTLDQKVLLEKALEELKKAEQEEVNYEVEMAGTVKGLELGDTVAVIHPKRDLYITARILKIDTSEVEDSCSITVGDALIANSGISAQVIEMARNFASQVQTYYTWVAYADDAKGAGISLTDTTKAYIGVATNQATPSPIISDPSVYTWFPATKTTDTLSTNISSLSSTVSKNNETLTDRVDNITCC